MPEERDGGGGEGGEGGEEERREFGDDVAFHLVICGPWRLGCVDVESCAGAEVVGFVFAFDIQAAYRR